jgi:hypothetical protein
MKNPEGLNPLSSLFGAMFATEILKALSAPKDVSTADAPKPVSEAEAQREQALKIDADAAADVLKLSDSVFASGRAVFFSDHPSGTGNWDEYDRPHRDKPHTYAQVTEMFSDGKKKAVSVVADGDVYLKNVGRAIALRRALDKPIPKEYFAAGSMLKKANTLEKDAAAAIAAVPAPAMPTVGAAPAKGKLFRVTADRKHNTPFLAGDIVEVVGFLGAVPDVKRLKDGDTKFLPTQYMEPFTGVQPGDTIKILKDGANNARVKAGDTFTVKNLTVVGDAICTEPVNTYGWRFTPDNFCVIFSPVKATLESPVAVASPAKTPTPPAPLKLPDEYAMLAVGDTVVFPDGKRRKVKEFAPCPNCKFPGFYGEGDTAFYHLYRGLKIEKATPAALTFKLGDTIKYRYEDGPLTVTEVTICGCGKPAVRVKERAGMLHTELCTLVKAAPEAAPVKPEAPAVKVGTPSGC